MKTAVASTVTSPRWRGEGGGLTFITHSIASVCRAVVWCLTLWAGLSLGWCLDLHLRPSRFILRWQKTHLSQAGQGYLVPSLTWLECVQESVTRQTQKEELQQATEGAKTRHECMLKYYIYRFKISNLLWKHTTQNYHIPTIKKGCWFEHQSVDKCSDKRSLYEKWLKQLRAELILYYQCVRWPFTSVS